MSKHTVSTPVQELMDTLEQRKAEEDRLHTAELLLRQEAKAAEDKAAMRAEVLRKWEANGGSVVDFEKTWDKLYQDIIYARTVEQMVQPRTRPTIQF